MTVGEAWITIAPAADIPDGHAARVEIDDLPIGIFNVGGEYFCVDDTCTHAEAALSDGDLDLKRCVIECPLHGSAFDLRSGNALTLPATEPVRVHQIEVVDGQLRVRLNQAPRE